jgi:hypothetical protein
MSSAAVAVTPTPSSKAEPAQSAAASRSRLFLFIALAIVLALRVLLLVLGPDRPSDFDQLYGAALRLAAGENPYVSGAQTVPYPLPAVLLAFPFTALPLQLARPIFDVLAGWAFGYALWRYRGSYALLGIFSGAYLFALWSGETTPLMVSASLVPVLGFLLAVKPNTSASLWAARPTWTGILGVSLFAGLSLLVMPSWPREWWLALPPTSSGQWAPPILRPLGFLLLVAALRWRLPEGRLLFAIAFLPQTTLPYELVSLALIPANLLEMGIYVAGSWIAVAAATGALPLGSADWARAGWPVTLFAGYLPMLFLVLRRQNRKAAEQKIGRDRRRRHRLPDGELEVDVSPSDEGGVTVTVTHLPTQVSATESGATRRAVARKAHDKLAAMIAERRNGPENNG